MKIKHYIITLAAFAVAAFTTTLHASGLPAPLPEFMSQEQAAKWQADRIAAAESKKTAAREQAAIQFYTGKPFDSSSESYLFKYRSYDPEFSRWTSADPSGFPDGANNHSYVNNMTTIALDPTGLAIFTYSSSFFKHDSWTETLYPNFEFGFPPGASISFEWRNSSGTSTNYFGERQSSVTLPTGMNWITGEIIDSTTDSGSLYGSYVNIPYTSRSVDQYFQTNWHAQYE